MTDELAQEMGKKQVQDIQDKIKAADFSKCAVPVVPESLSYLVSGMQTLIESKNGDSNEMEIPIPLTGGKVLKGRPSDILRLALVAGVVFLIYMNFTDKDERNAVRQDIKNWHKAQTINMSGPNKTAMNQEQVSK